MMATVTLTQNLISTIQKTTISFGWVTGVGKVGLSKIMSLSKSMTMQVHTQQLEQALGLIWQLSLRSQMVNGSLRWICFMSPYRLMFLALSASLQTIFLFR